MNFFRLMIWFPVRTSVQTSNAEKFKIVHRVQFLNLAASILDQELCTSNVVSLSSQPNSSSFQDSSTDLVSEITAGCISGCVIPEIEENSTPKSKYHTGGGITCCVPNCFNNSVRNKELSFYVIPRDNRLRN